MASDDEIKNGAQDLKGQAKEAVGEATDNHNLEVEGKLDQAGAQIKQGAADLKDKVTGDDK